MRELIKALWLEIIMAVLTTSLLFSLLKAISGVEQFLALVLMVMTGYWFVRSWSVILRRAFRD